MVGTVKGKIKTAMSCPVHGIRVVRKDPGKKHAGSAAIGTCTRFLLEGHMAPASTGGLFLRTREKIDMTRKGTYQIIKLWWGLITHGPDPSGVTDLDRKKTMAENIGT